ncbi:hypothetical protein WR164_04290 [Philodulcilactobacillus myokoensis]|uniref:Uncharacterized protein n=1 Tax=Philodulcilactobacillus myokoensis TaxID=2929573 RepID=A0A9W6B014_9LACO|nr:hypothetical protein [Philodulcilactobacillus myokoensis]GLB46450.1 hypothetical protein WR164_04290 [Philodulcilactobacillus myokoensis]
MISMMKNFSMGLLYIVWISLGATLLAYISKLIPGQAGSLAVIILLFLLTYLPIRWFNHAFLKEIQAKLKINHKINHHLKLN